MRLLFSPLAANQSHRRKLHPHSASYRPTSGNLVGFPFDRTTESHSRLQIDFFEGRALVVFGPPQPDPKRLGGRRPYLSFR
jgi:hypothetical protein